MPADNFMTMRRKMNEQSFRKNYDNIQGMGGKVRGRYRKVYGSKPSKADEGPNLIGIERRGRPKVEVQDVMAEILKEA